MPRRDDIQSVLVIGSGPIVIGQAAEFDYAGTQACRALREEGKRVILVNSNPATIMTDEGVADVVYIEPLTVEVAARASSRASAPTGCCRRSAARPASTSPSQLADAGVLERYDVGCSARRSRRSARPRTASSSSSCSIEHRRAGRRRARSSTTVEDALRLRRARSACPLVIRPAYTLGGTGGGIAPTPRASWSASPQRGLAASPIGQVLVEQYLARLERDRVRGDARRRRHLHHHLQHGELRPDGRPHRRLHRRRAQPDALRPASTRCCASAALRIIRALGIEGGCNVQFALDPHSFALLRHRGQPARQPLLGAGLEGDRLSRSPASRPRSPSASGWTRSRNAVTGKTTAAFEPALDYCVVKIPRWPFDKFPLADRTLGTQMKATGEVMAIDRTFEAALQKAVRSLELRRRLLWEAPTCAEEPDASA